MQKVDFAVYHGAVMTITLRPYQDEALASIPQSGRHIIALATGLGKTVLFSQIPRKGRVLILSHREELVNQPVKYYDCPVGIERASETAAGEEVVSASVQSIVRRLDKYRPDDFDIVIVDECFPKGTLIDGLRIENIKSGNMVRSYNHAECIFEYKKVLKIFKSKPSCMVNVNLKNGLSIPCTFGHPFYIKGVGYVEAGNLESGMQVLWSDDNCGYKMEKGKTEKRARYLLFKGVYKSILQKYKFCDNGKNKQVV